MGCDKLFSLQPLPHVESVDASSVPPLPQRAYIKASNAATGDQFGFSLALSLDGTTLAVNAPYEDSDADTINGNQSDDSAIDAGAVYVFRQNDGVWQQEAYVKAFNSDAGDRFGFSLGLSDDGNTLVVGAGLEDSGGTGPGAVDDNAATNAGAVYVFVRSGSTWTQEPYIKASNTQSGDQFGYYVAISGDGNTIAAGALSEDSAAQGSGGNQADNTAPGSGAVYVFARTGSWTQQAYLKASNTQSNAQFDNPTLSTDGNTLAVTAGNESSATKGINGNGNDTTAAGAGAAYVFVRSGSAWSQQAYIKASNTGPNDNFGRDVVLSGDGNMLVVGAPFEDSAMATDQNDDSATDSGATYVFTRSGTLWMQRAYLKASTIDADDQFGVRLALAPDGLHLVVGATNEASGATGADGAQDDNSLSASGAAYVVDNVDDAWVQLHYVKASNPDQDDRFGLPAIGNGVIALSAPYEDSASIGIDAMQTDNGAMDAGAVYLFY